MEPENIQQAALDEALVSTDDRVKIGSCNMRIDPNKKQKEATYQVVLDILKLSPCYNAFLITANVPQIYMQQFWFIPNKEFVAPPPHDALVTFLKQLGYKGSLDLISDMFVDHIYQPWRTFATIINNCLSGKTLDIQYQIDNRQTSAKRREMMPYPRVTKGIIDYFLSKHKSIPKRHGSLINIIKDDDVLGKLKSVSKGKDEQKYGMSSLDLIMNDDIKDSEAYLTDIALSIGTELPKKGRQGKGKGLIGKKVTITPKKKSLMIAEDNIIPDPDVALKLGESISLTKAEEPEEQRRVHETHECIVTEKSSKSEVAESDKADEETDDDEEIHDDEEVHKDKEVHDDDEKHDANEVADEEKADEKMPNSEKFDKEMADAEKDDAEKIEKEKVDDEQAELTKLELTKLLNMIKQELRFL
ncbi:hypothetical protein Tco_0013967 [Tanacetum coccineum]